MLLPDPSSQQLLDSSSQQKPHLVIVGGGAAGFFTALTTAEKCRENNIPVEITILEAGRSPLQKVRISGGGRCNVTHACFDPKQLLQYYPRGQKELPGLFSRFQPSDMVEWLSRHGLQLNTEPDGRMFPVENTSEALIDCFLEAARDLGIHLKTGQRVTAIFEKAGQGFWVNGMLNGTETTLSADYLVLATGYSPIGWDIAKALGHTVIPPVASLFPFKTKTSVLSGLQGISLPDVLGKLLIQSAAYAKSMQQTVSKPQRYQAQGPLLITHTGISGPLIYRLSALAARGLAESSYQAKLVLDLLPHYTEEKLKERFEAEIRQVHALKLMKNIPFDPLPQRLWWALLVQAEVLLESPGQSLSQKQMNRLVDSLKRLSLDVVGKSPSKEEFVSCGGVDLREVDCQRLESKKSPGLYLVGEILNIDGLTGGFNFQACWSGAWTVSSALTEALKLKS